MIVILILFLIIAVFMLAMISACIVSGRISRKEEEAYIPKHLDPKDLDDEFKFEDILEYDDTFIKKDRKKNEKRDNI